MSHFSRIILPLMLLVITVPISSKPLDEETQRWMIFGYGQKLDEIYLSTQYIKEFLDEHADALDEEKMAMVLQMLNQIMQQVVTNEQQITYNRELIAVHLTNANAKLQAMTAMLSELQYLTQQLLTQNNGACEEKISLLLTTIREISQALHALSLQSLCNCEKITKMMEVLGTLDQSSTDPDKIHCPYDIDDAQLTVIELLKTIYRKLCEEPIS